MLYQSNKFVMDITVVHNLRTAILPNIQPTPSASLVWNRGWRAIKTLPALRHFTLIYKPGYGCQLDGLLRVLEPLKDLRLKHSWELRMECEEEGIAKAVGPILKRAGFDCFVSQYTNLQLIFLLA